MTNVQFNENDRYQDYDAQLYFKACGFVNTSFSTKTAKVNEETCVLVHVRATAPDGRIVETDLWPRNEATAEDLTKVGEPLEDFEFRVGFYTDEETGEVTSGAPKHLLCHGDKREFRG